MKYHKHLVFLSSFITIAMILFMPYSGRYITLVVFLLGIILSITYFRQSRKCIEEDLISLSQDIQNMIDGTLEHKEIHYSDELTSKINHQIAKLSQRLVSSHHAELNERKRLESLISDISHQLRTPLANVHLYLSLIEEDDNNKGNEHYQSIKHQLGRFEWLSNSLVKLSKIESGCITIKKEEHPLNTVVLDAINNVHGFAKRSGITIDFKPSREVARYDKKWTSEALFNILENSVKYSPTGSTITINIDHTELYTKIIVSDQGIGIQEHEINKIFKRFYRSPDVHDKDGIGIGLYLSQEIMNHQQGYIYATSNKQGSTFAINFKN